VAACAHVLVNTAAAWAAEAGVGVWGLESPARQSGEGGGFRARSFASGSHAPTTDMKESAGNTILDDMTREALDDAIFRKHD
jgi:hypothetical protein